MTLEKLAEMLMSSEGEAELTVLNPLLSDGEAYAILQQLASFLCGHCVPEVCGAKWLARLESVIDVIVQ